jgi:hypothetical protein
MMTFILTLKGIQVPDITIAKILDSWTDAAKKVRVNVLLSNGENIMLKFQSEPKEDEIIVEAQKVYDNANLPVAKVDTVESLKAENESLKVEIATLQAVKK